MTDFLFQMGLSNACLAIALAIVAMVVGASANRPHLAHLLWLLVFGAPSDVLPESETKILCELSVIGSRVSCPSGPPSSGNGNGNQQRRSPGKEI